MKLIERYINALQKLGEEGFTSDPDVTNELQYCDSYGNMIRNFKRFESDSSALKETKLRATFYDPMAATAIPVDRRCDRMTMWLEYTVRPLGLYNESSCEYNPDNIRIALDAAWRLHNRICDIIGYPIGFNRSQITPTVKIVELNGYNQLVICGQRKLQEPKHAEIKKD